MELNLELTPEDGADNSLESAGLSSPMGGKHQRDLSLSAKWASNKALALEYLKRQREAILWIESVLERKLSRDLFEALKSGIVLRELLVKLYPDPTAQCKSPISRRYSLTMAPWKERENISIFLKHCKSMGMNDTFLFCTDDLYEGTNMVQVLFSIQHFMAFSRERSRYVFKTIAEESISFSNQELEMALSKIEQAGVDVNSLLSSAPASASPSPAKSHFEDQEPISVDSSSTATSESASDDIPSTPTSESANDHSPSTAGNEPDTNAVEAKKEQEPAEDEYEDNDGEDEQAALEILAVELQAHDNNHASNEEEISQLENDASVCDHEISRGELHDDDEVGVHVKDEDSMDREPHDVDGETQPLDPEYEDDTLVLQGSANATSEAAIFTLVAAELDESILLLEIIDEMLYKIESSRTVTETRISEIVAIDAQAMEMKIPTDIEVVRLSSADLTDKRDTYVGDSQAPTVADTHIPAEAETESPENKFARATRASKKASKAGKKRRESSNEPLDAEAMSKCTCGSKCSIM